MKWKLLIAGLVIGGAVAFPSVAFHQPQEGQSFDGLYAARLNFAAHGLHCISDCANGKVDSGFLVSRDSTSPDELNLLCKGRMGPEWAGKVWVTLVRSQTPLQTIPENAGARVWGEVMAFGDEEFLRELDRLIKPR